MEVKDNIRQRRKERIKHIVDRGKDEPVEGAIASSYRLPSPQAASSRPTIKPSRLSEPDQPGRMPSGVETLDADPRLHDPEYVWKNRHRLEQTQPFYGDDKTESRRYQERWKQWMLPPSIRQFRLKLLLCAVLFALVWGWFQIHQPWAESGKQWIRSALTEDMNFSESAAIYKRMFQGSPSLLPAFLQSKIKDAAAVKAESANFYPPVLGTIAVPFNESKQGVNVQTRTGAPVTAMDTGIVTFVGISEQWGLTVKIRHANQYESVYGGIGESLVRENEWIRGGAQLGTVGGLQGERNSKLFFAIKKSDNYIDPADVISFD